jgi:hypothetical protein
MSEDAHLLRSQLIHRQKKDLAELEKDSKKKKGALKEAAQVKIEEMLVLHEQELQAFDAEHSIKHKQESTSAPSVVDPESQVAVFKAKSLAKLSKKELEELCAEHGLSKKGSKEEITSRLLTVTKKSGESLPQEPSISEKEVKSPAKDEDSAAESSESSEESSDDEEQVTKKKSAPVFVTPEEEEKQVKRERIVQKGILHLFEQRFPKGFKLEDLPKYLEKIGVVNFKPDSLGYKDLHDFARKQPKEIIVYDKKHAMLLPGKGEEERERKK